MSRGGIWFLNDLVAKLKDDLSLDDNVIATASELFRKRPQESYSSYWACAALLAAIRIQKCSVLSDGEFLDLCGIPYRFGYMDSEVGMTTEAKMVLRRYRKLLGSGNQDQRVCHFHPHLYLEKLFRLFEIPAETKKKAWWFADEMVKQRAHIGLSPSLLAGGLFWAACVADGVEIAQCKIAQALGKSDSAIRGCYFRAVTRIKLDFESYGFPRKPGDVYRMYGRR